MTPKLRILLGVLLVALPLDQLTKYWVVSVLPQGESVQIAFADDGKGMDATTTARVFEPFFTRNRAGGGTGLGLHIVYNLVNAKLDGRIRCDSKPGGGTSFVLDLPRHTTNTDSNERADHDHGT